MTICDWCGKELTQPMVSISPDEYPDNWVNHITFHRNCFEKWFIWSKEQTENKMIMNLAGKVNMSAEECECDTKE